MCFYRCIYVLIMYYVFIYLALHSCKSVNELTYLDLYTYLKLYMYGCVISCYRGKTATFMEISNEN